MKKALEVAKNKFGRLDTLVNCAGYSNAHQTYNFYKNKECGLEGFAKCVNVSSFAKAFHDCFFYNTSLLRTKTPKADDNFQMFIQEN